MSRQAVSKRTLPEGWREVRLGDVCRLLGGAGFPEKYQGKPSGDYPFIKVSDMNSPENKIYINRSKNWITSATKKKIRANHCPGGSVVFAKVGAALKLNRRRITTRDTIVDNNMMGAIPIGSKVKSKFLYYYLTTLDFGKFSQESAIPSVNQKILGSLLFMLPPLPEQKAIAGILENWDKAIEKTEKLITEKERQFDWLVKTLISDQMDNPAWQRIRLGSIGEISSAGVDKKIVEGEKNVRLINYLDVFRRDTIYSEDLGHTVTAPDTKISKCSVRKGDIFFTPSSEVREDIGHSAVAMEDMPDVVYSYHVVRLRPFIKLDLLYSAYAFKAYSFYKQASKFADGSGQRYVISQNNFRKMEISLPTLAEQGRIAEILDTGKREINCLKSHVERYRRQKQALMQKFLTGNWRVK